MIALILFYKGAEKVPSLHSGLILLLEPVVVVIVDVLFFGTFLSTNILIGIFAVLGGNVYLIVKSSAHERKLNEM